MFSLVKVSLVDSKFYTLVSVLVFCVAGLALIASSVEPFAKLVLVVFLLLSAYLRMVFPLNQNIAGLAWSTHTNELLLILSSGAEVRTAPPEAIFVLPWMLGIKIYPESGIPAQWMILLPDMMSSNDWRKLSVISRWQSFNR